MRILTIAGVILSVTLFTPLAAAATGNTNQVLEQIVTDAQNVRGEAREIKQLLRASQPDLALVHQRLAALSTHADALKQAIDGFDVASANLTSTQLAAFERMRVATDSLRALLANKAALLADGEGVGKNRSLLRAKAEGIAKRADIVEQQVTKLRG